MRHFWSIIGLTGASLCLSACGQQDERKARLSKLYDAVIVQLEESENPSASALENAAPEERALAGRLSESARIQIAQERAQIAVGSIIVKPRVVAQMQAIVRAKSRNIAPGVPDTSNPSRETPGSQAPVPNQGEGIRAPAPPSIFSSPAFRNLSEETLPPRVMEAMITAQSSMFEEMDKLGLEGTITSTPESGQMVIDMFASASQLADNVAPDGPFIAEDTALECPATFNNDAMKSDKVLATNCMVEILRASGNYEYVEKDFIFHNQFAKRPPNSDSFLVTPDDTLWDLQWHFKNNGNEADQSAGGAGFVDFWTRQGETGSKGVVVAVVDTGLALSHPDIANSPNLAPGWDMVTDPDIGNDGDGRDNNPDDPGDLCNPNIPGAQDSYHGTHVAGTIGAAATNNGAGVSGGAWSVTIVPVRALGKCGGRLSDINDAIRWAGGIMPAESALGAPVFNQNPADIINLSVGLFQRCPASMQDAIDAVVERGAIVVAAAGNARLGTEFYAPASCNNVITVAAGDARGHIAPYSNFGPEVDILAPGGDLDRDDNGDGRPDGVLSTRPAKDCYDPVTGAPIENCNYAFEQGTSMAAPHVSAALALLAARDPDLTGPQLTGVLLSTLMPRDGEQCTARCDIYPDATPIPGQPGRCLRSCGGLLNLGNLDTPGSDTSP